MVTTSTEEGLSDATAKYVAKHGGDSALRRASLRWSPCDSPLHLEGRSPLVKSEALREQGPDPYDDAQESDQTVSMIFEVAVEVLRELERDGIPCVAHIYEHAKMGSAGRWRCRRDRSPWRRWVERHGTTRSTRER